MKINVGICAADRCLCNEGLLVMEPFRNHLKTHRHRRVTGAVRIMAKHLIRTRHHQITKFYSLKSQLQGVALRVQTLKSTQAMGEAMKGVTKAMGQMNREMSLPGLQKIMQEFERQNERMEMTTEIMNDALGDATAGEEETDDNQVLDEIGIDIDQQLLKMLKLLRHWTLELQARLDNLRKM